MFKDVQVTVYRMSQEEYDALPFTEEYAEGTNTAWKQFHNVTFFRPYEHQAFDNKPTCTITFVAPQGSPNIALTI